jgi:hypothetical protein
MSDMPMMLQYFAQVNQIQQEECITIAKNQSSFSKYFQIGKMIQPTNKKFHLEFCTVAHWKNGKILEERLFYDQMGMLKQICAI